MAKQSITVHIEGLREFDRAMKRLTPEVQKQFRADLKKIAQDVASEAKGRASWSRRIPGAISATVTAKGAGVRLSKKKAPHGGLYERGSSGNRRMVRHPLFGNTDFWFETPIRPFIEPAVQSKRDDAKEAFLDALQRAKKGVGLYAG